MKVLKEAMKNRIRNYISTHHDATPNDVWKEEFHWQGSPKMVARIYGEVWAEKYDDCPCTMS